MELLAKMSEAYMKEKAEKTEVAARVATLEAENKTLKNQLTEARRRELEEKERSQEVCDRFYLLRFTHHSKQCTLGAQSRHWYWLDLETMGIMKIFFLEKLCWPFRSYTVKGCVILYFQNQGCEK